MLEPKNQNQQPNFSELSTKRSRLGAWVVLGATALISGQPNSARADDPAPNPAPAPTAPVNGGKPFSVDLTPPKPASDELFAKVAQYRAKDRPELPYVLYAVQEVARRHPDISAAELEVFASRTIARVDEARRTLTGQVSNPKYLGQPQTFDELSKRGLTRLFEAALETGGSDFIPGSKETLGVLSPVYKLYKEAVHEAHIASMKDQIDARDAMSGPVADGMRLGNAHRWEAVRKASTEDTPVGRTLARVLKLDLNVDPSASTAQILADNPPVADVVRILEKMDEIKNLGSKATVEQRNQLDDFQKELNKNLDTKLQKFKEEVIEKFSEVTTALDASAKKAAEAAQLAAEAQSRADVIKGFEYTSSIISSLAYLSNDPKFQRVARDVVAVTNATIQIASGINALISNPGTVGALACGGGYLAAASILMQAFSSKSGPTADEIIIEQLGAIQKQLGQIQESIVAIDKHLGFIHTEMTTGFARMYEYLSKIDAKLVNIEVSVGVAYNVLVSHAQDTIRLELQTQRLIQDLFQRENKIRIDYLEQYRDLFRGDPLPREEWRKGVSLLKSLAGQANDRATIGEELKTAADLLFARARERIEQKGLTSQLDYLVQFSAIVLKNNNIPVLGERVPDPALWISRVTLLLRLLYSHPEYLGELDGEVALKELAGQGRLIINALKSLSALPKDEAKDSRHGEAAEVETTIYKQFLDYYKTRLDQVVSAVKQAQAAYEADYAASYSFDGTSGPANTSASFRDEDWNVSYNGEQGRVPKALRGIVDQIIPGDLVRLIGVSGRRVRIEWEMAFGFDARETKYYTKYTNSLNPQPYLQPYDVSRMDVLFYPYLKIDLIPGITEAKRLSLGRFYHSIQEDFPRDDKNPSHSAPASENNEFAKRKGAIEDMGRDQWHFASPTVGFPRPVDNSKVVYDTWMDIWNKLSGSKALHFDQGLQTVFQAAQARDRSAVVSMGIRPDQVDAVYSALIALDDAKYVMDRYLEISLPRLFIENSDLPEQAYTNLGLWNSAKFNEVARAEVSNIRLACSDAGLPGVLERWTRFKSVLAHVAHTLSVNPERFDQLEAVLEEIETARRVIRRANEVKDQNTEAKGQK